MHELARAVEEGAAVEPQPGAPTAFNALLDAEEERRLGRALSMQLTVLGSVIERGLTAARSGKLVTAQRQIDRAQVLLEVGQWRDEMRLMGESSLHATAAYVSYCHARWDEALAHVAYSGRSDLRLEREFGWELYELHRLQLLHNVARVDARRGQWRRALRLAAGLLALLETARPELLPASAHEWAVFFDEERLRRHPDILRALHEQIAREAVSMLAFAAKQERPEAIAEELQTIAGELSRAAPELDTQISRWLTLRAAVAGGHEAASCPAALPLLRAGRVPSPPLWLDARTLVVG